MKYLNGLNFISVLFITLKLNRIWEKNPKTQIIRVETILKIISY